ncbi:zinc finger BED domain-containing protein RICESLEEPER 2-like protein [Tanacetum coccineum]
MIIGFEADHELEANQHWKLNQVAKAIVSIVDEEQNTDNQRYIVILNSLKETTRHQCTMVTSSKRFFARKSLQRSFGRSFHGFAADVTEAEMEEVGRWRKLGERKSRLVFLGAVMKELSASEIGGMLARDVMAIEYVFSMSGRMLDALRSSLAPPDVESLICTQVGFVTSQKIRMRCKTLKKVLRCDFWREAAGIS